MQYVGRAIGSVSKTWNSINPATLSGAIDVIVVEQENGDLSCSPFHVRFGKFSLLRPSQKKVEFAVNGEKVDLPMKLGEGGEAFFVFETEGVVPKDLLTSPVISPSSSPSDSPKTPEYAGGTGLQEPEFLDLTVNGGDQESSGGLPSSPGKALAAISRFVGVGGGANDSSSNNPLIATVPHSITMPEEEKRTSWGSLNYDNPNPRSARSSSPPLTREQAIERVKMLTKKLTDVNIPSKISDNGDIILDITGYKSGEEDVQHSDQLVRKILCDEFGLTPDGLESIVGVDDQGNLRISSRDDDKNHNFSSFDDGATDTSTTIPSNDTSGGLVDSSSSDANSATIRQSISKHHFASDPNLLATAATTATTTSPLSKPIAFNSTTTDDDNASHYVKTLRLTSDQLKSLNLHSGVNDMSFTVNRAICTSRIFYWSCKDPIVISDIDGTITKSDALGHVLTMLGRDWTHLGVGKLFTDIANNGYNIMYLTARSVGQADTTRYYLKSVDQNGYKLPDGPVILSPDRTMAALRREVIMKKPEVFKMACLRDIQMLYGADREETPFFAGFGNRITDALSYRSVGVPSSKIFTINANSEVHMELLELAGYKSSYVSITQLVDHFFPPVLLSSGGQSQQSYSDVNYWREPILDLSDLEEEDEDVNRSTDVSNAATTNAAYKKNPLVRGRSPGIVRTDTVSSEVGDEEEDDDQSVDASFDQSYDDEDDDEEEYDEENDDENSDSNEEYDDFTDVEEDEEVDGEDDEEEESSEVAFVDTNPPLEDTPKLSSSTSASTSSSPKILKIQQQPGFIKATEALQSLQL